jgi:NAD(P)-dependent dehydrogenase (short-subunit alcohol dehydrogenase family)
MAYIKERPMGEKTPNAAQLEADDKQYVMRPWTHPAGEPVIVAKAKNCVITDIHGKDYLDLTAGYFVNAAGHCHPKIAEAATRQLHEVLQVSGKHGSIPVIQLAKKLKQLAPKSVDKSFFSTGGSEANEFALKAARQVTKKTDIAYLQNGYHGLTLGSLEVTASEKYRESAGKPLGTDNYAIPTAYCYRCKFGPASKCKVECLDGVEAQFDALLGVHFKGMLFLTQAVAPLLADGGRILNVSTGLTRIILPGFGAYAAMKAAVQTLTLYLAKELGERRIRVNVLAPGAIPSHLEGILRRSSQEVSTGKRDFEINPQHAVVKRLGAIAAENPSDPDLREWLHLLHEQALLSEGSALPDPNAFSKRVTTLLTRALG